MMFIYKMIIEENGIKFYIDATIEEVGAMSKAKLKSRLIPYDDYLNSILIKDLSERIENIKITLPSDEELIEIGKNHSQEWIEYNELINELYKIKH